ncbi:MAG TPA: zf-HC2 domain-containing protein [Bryobacteraceae bacterium]
MDHKLAEQTEAVDKYLLDELPAAQRLEFEEHLFDCPVCAELVRHNAIVVDNLKQVLLEERPQASERHAAASSRPGRFHWLLNWTRPATLVPTFATVILAAVVGYQNLVSIPALLRPQALQAVPIASAERGSSPFVQIDRRQPMFNLSFDVDSPQAYPSYVCDFQSVGQGTVLRVNSGARQVASFNLDLLLPAREFPPGHYVMILRPAFQSQIEIERYSFVVQDKDVK